MTPGLVTSQPPKTFGGFCIGPGPNVVLTFVLEEEAGEINMETLYNVYIFFSLFYSLDSSICFV